MKRLRTAPVGQSARKLRQDARDGRLSVKRPAHLEVLADTGTKRTLARAFLLGIDPSPAPPPRPRRGPSVPGAGVGFGEGATAPVAAVPIVAVRLSESVADGHESTLVAARHGALRSGL